MMTNHALYAVSPCHVILPFQIHMKFKWDDAFATGLLNSKSAGKLCVSIYTIC